MSANAYESSGLSKSTGERRKAADWPAGEWDSYFEANDGNCAKVTAKASRSRLYALVKEKAFPAPLSLGKRTVAWESSEVQSWLEARVKAPRKLGGSAVAGS